MRNRNLDIQRYTHHFGESMAPILVNRDILVVTREKQVKRGDIILFISSDQDEEEWVAHRIVAIRDGKVFTKGDNNPAIDDRSIHLDEIAGIVTSRWRNGKKLTIFRGRKGVVQYYFYTVYYHVRKVLGASIGKLVLPARLQSALRKVLPAPKEVHFARESRQIKALYLGNIHIGTYSEQNKCWQIRFPYRIIYGNIGE